MLIKPHIDGGLIIEPRGDLVTERRFFLRNLSSWTLQRASLGIILPLYRIIIPVQGKNVIYVVMHFSKGLTSGQAGRVGAWLNVFDVAVDIRKRFRPRPMAGAIYLKKINVRFLVPPGYWLMLLIVLSDISRFGYKVQIIMIQPMRVAWCGMIPLLGIEWPGGDWTDSTAKDQVGQR